MFGNLGSIAKIAISMVPGPIGGIVGGILGGILGGGKAGQSNQAMLGSLQQVLGKLFGQSAGSQGTQAPVLALPFSMNGQAALALVQNPFGAFQGLEQQMGQFSQMLNNLTRLLNPASSGGAASGIGGGVGAEMGSAAAGASSSAPASTTFSSGNEGLYSKIDSMMEQAEKLMNSEKPSDQLKAQNLMQKAQRMFEMISKMMERRSEMMSKAIQAIK